METHISKKKDLRNLLVSNTFFSFKFLTVPTKFISALDILLKNVQ